MSTVLTGRSIRCVGIHLIERHHTERFRQYVDRSCRSGVSAGMS